MSRNVMPEDRAVSDMRKGAGAAQCRHPAFFGLFAIATYLRIF